MIYGVPGNLPVYVEDQRDGVAVQMEQAAEWQTNPLPADDWDKSDKTLDHMK